MGIETITEKILAEANDDARRIYDKGKYDGRSAVYRIERLIKQKQSDLEEKTAADVENVKQRRHSVAQLEARKMRLAAKQEVIESCFEEAVRRLCDLPEADYIALLEKSIGKLDVQEGELLLNRKDRAEIGPKLLERLQKSGKAGALVLSEETINAAGGFVLRAGTVEINSTLEVMVDAVRDDVTPAVIRSLFGEN